MADHQQNLSLWKWLFNMRLHARIGAAVAVIFSCGIAGGLAAHHLPHAQYIIWGASGALLIAGLVALHRSAEVEPEAAPNPCHGTCSAACGSEPTKSEYPPSVFTRRYWGWVALGCAVAVFLAPSPPKKVVREAAPVSAAKTNQVALIEKTNAPATTAPDVPPSLKLQGIHLLPRHPAAIINGKTYIAGDVVAGFSVVQINPDSVMVEKDGEKHLLLLASGARR